MKTRETPVVSVRKRPQQARSAQLVEDILEAAIRVLTREGARRFTAARVAEAAGVSVGSLYQYFPNKEAILFRLQTDEWTRTRALLESVLFDTSRSPADRLRLTVREFFRSEYEEADFRLALDDAAPLYRDSPEAPAHQKEVRKRALAFMKEALPDLAPKKRAFAANVMMTTLATLGEQVSNEARSKEDVDAWAQAIGDMLCAYIDKLAVTG
ncbi:TetR family transcriptional regulator [Paraburkholderia sp. BCC1886]|uniref:TetR family transcriptional regulator n=1 Tax=Paraburkholderia sp. BCC1886 TaxID=2562670 RepID=UPI0011831532|nr:TetR family transcriptional regulator [Paraburkholderia sp. BCC1886]